MENLLDVCITEEVHVISTPSKFSILNSQFSILHSIFYNEEIF